MFFFLVYIRTLNREFYQKIEAKEYSIQEVATEFYRLVPSDLDEHQLRKFLYLEAQLTNMYFNYKSTRRGARLFLTNKDGLETTDIYSKLDKSDKNEDYIKILKSVATDWEKSDLSIELLLKRINLIDPVIT